MTVNLRFSLPLPEGMTVFEGQVEVSGVRHHRDGANAFARGKGHELELVPEPSNRHDGRSVKVVGVTRGWLFDRRRLLGYLPRETAAELSRRGLAAKARPRLCSIWAPGNGYVVVRLDVLAPIGAA